MHRLSKRNMTVPEMFREMAAKCPDKVCLKCEDHELTFAQVSAASS